MGLNGLEGIEPTGPNKRFFFSGPVVRMLPVAAAVTRKGVALPCLALPCLAGRRRRRPQQLLLRRILTLSAVQYMKGEGREAELTGGIVFTPNWYDSVQTFGWLKCNTLAILE